MAATVVEFVFFDGVTSVVVKHEFSEVTCMLSAVEYVYNSRHFFGFISSGFHLKTVNIL